MPITEHMKLSDLTRLIQGVISSSFDNRFFWVIAEISGHKFYKDTDRHYLELVEKIEGSGTETSKIKAKAWFEGSKNIRRFEEQTGQIFENGLSVLVKVKVEYQVVHGLSVTIFDIDESFTLGNIAKQREATLRRLLAENADSVFFQNGQFSSRNKQLVARPVIQYIALVASPNSDGYKDFIHSLSENQFGYKFRVDNYFSSVQGKEAENELVETFKKIYYSNSSYDAVVVIRGGGSKTDFLVFDTYNVSRVIARFPIPVITGIGHHADVSIVDMMAHTSTKTPTQAAEFIISGNRRFEDLITDFKQRFGLVAQKMIGKAGRHLHEFELALVEKPRRLLSNRINALVTANNRLSTAARNSIGHHASVLGTRLTDLKVNLSLRLSKERNQVQHIFTTLKTTSGQIINTEKLTLDRFHSAIKLASPENIVKRGFAIIRKKGNILASEKQLHEQDEIEIETRDQHIKASILTVIPKEQ